MEPMTAALIASAGLQAAGGAMGMISGERQAQRDRKEARRQFNENLAFEKQSHADQIRERQKDRQEQQRQFNQNFSLSQEQLKENKSQFDKSFYLDEKALRGQQASFAGRLAAIGGA